MCCTSAIGNIAGGRRAGCGMRGAGYGMLVTRYGVRGFGIDKWRVIRRRRTESRNPVDFKTIHSCSLHPEKKVWRKRQYPKSNTPALHHSNIPILQYPRLQYSKVIELLHSINIVLLIKKLHIGLINFLKLEYIGQITQLVHF